MDKILKLKAEMFDLLRRRDTLVAEVNNIQAIVQEKAKELDSFENKK